MDYYSRYSSTTTARTKKLRVAAYCRVSTDKSDQANSFESQKRYFDEYITRRSDWTLFAIYTDEGVTGTSVKKRNGFMRMIEDARSGYFDLIITKEISRFARNTLDSIAYTRELRRMGIGVFFLNDNINTLDPDAELRLTIMSSIAQEESRRTSERVKWGQKRRMEQGVVFGRSMLGYDVENGQMTVNEEGAAIVRLIFHKFVNEGKGTFVIARELREAGIETYRGIKSWSNTVILRVLRNEKYCGDLVQKKTYTPDFLTHEKKYNRGEDDFVIIRDHHEPIISREMFERANRELDRRGGNPAQSEKHSARYCFSGKIKCGRCGSTYVARYKTRKDGSKYKAWRCGEAAQHGSPKTDAQGNTIGCNGHYLRDEEAREIMQQVFSAIDFDRERTISSIVKLVMGVLRSGAENDGELEQHQLELSRLQAKKDRLIELYTNGDIAMDCFQREKEKIEAEAISHRTAMDRIKQRQTSSDDIEGLERAVREKIDDILEADTTGDELIRTVLDKMIITGDQIEVSLCLLPYKWSFFLSGVAKKPEQPQKCKTGTDILGKTATDTESITATDVWNVSATDVRSIIDTDVWNTTDTDVGTEELGHLEMVGAMVQQLTRCLNEDQLKKDGFDAYFVDHTNGVYPSSAAGVPWMAAYIQSKGDIITDLHEDLAAEQKARVTYDNLLRLNDDPDVREVLKFLRAREIVHYQRFGEALRIVTDRLNEKNYYAVNPGFDKQQFASSKQTPAQYKR